MNYLLLANGRRTITPIPRGPLGPFDHASTDPQTGAPLPVATTLPYTINPQPSILYRRENAWGVTVPNLPVIPGGADGPAKDRLLSWFIDRYSLSDQESALLTYAERGYTHFTLSWPDSRAVGQSIDDYVRTAKRVQSFGLWVDHHFFSKDFDGQNPDPVSVYAVIDALRDAGAIDCATVGWELNAFNSPEHIQTLIDGVCQQTEGIPTYLHFLPHYASWQGNHEKPTDFWVRQQGKIQGLKYQCVPDWSVGMMQARINDVLVRLIRGGVWGLPQTFDVIGWETIATLQFNNDADEDRGDLVGFETLCSPGPMPLSGFGNGARMPDGAVI